MPHFTKGNSADGGRFGVKQILRSTHPGSYSMEHYTIAAASVVPEDVAGTTMPFLQRGEALAKITSGDEAGKVGPFQADATDGREDVANLVGVNDTFLPYQLMDGDMQVAVYYRAVAVAGWCTERDAAGARVPITQTTIDALRGKVDLDVLFT